MPGYTRPPGTEGVPWEDFREETGGSDDRAEFQAWLTRQKMAGRYDQLSDFQSPYYQQFRSFLGSVTPSVGTNTILAGLQAGGGNYGASQVQANARVDELARERNDFLNTTVSGFALQSQGQADTLLGGIMQSNQFQQGLEEQQRQFDAMQPDFWDYALTGMGMLTSMGGLVGDPGQGNARGGASGAMGAGGGFFSGAGGSAASSSPAFAASDWRLKENIKKVGTSLNGINIYEFNYKGGNIKYRGAMADENLHASKEIDGYKYLDYSKIDVSFEVI